MTGNLGIVLGTKAPGQWAEGEPGGSARVIPPAPGRAGSGPGSRNTPSDHLRRAQTGRTSGFFAWQAPGRNRSPDITVRSLPSGLQWGQGLGAQSQDCHTKGTFMRPDLPNPLPPLSLQKREGHRGF